MRSCPLKFRVFSSIPGSHSQEVNSIPFTVLTTKNVTKHCQVSPGWGWEDKTTPPKESLLYRICSLTTTSVSTPLAHSTSSTPASSLFLQYTKSPLDFGPFLCLPFSAWNALCILCPHVNISSKIALLVTLYPLAYFSS